MAILSNELTMQNNPFNQFRFVDSTVCSVDMFYTDQFANVLNAAMCLLSIPSPVVITSSAKASANSTASISVIGVFV